MNGRRFRLLQPNVTALHPGFRFQVIRKAIFTPLMYCLSEPGYIPSDKLLQGQIQAVTNEQQGPQVAGLD